METQLGAVDVPQSPQHNLEKTTELKETFHKQGNAI